MDRLLGHGTLLRILIKKGGSLPRDSGHLRLGGFLICSSWEVYMCFTLEKKMRRKNSGDKKGQKARAINFSLRSFPFPGLTTNLHFSISCSNGHDPSLS